MSLRSPSCDGGSVLLMNLHWEQQLPLCSVSWARTCWGGWKGGGRSGSHRLSQMVLVKKCRYW